MIKPGRLEAGDTIATISPCNGWAGDEGIRWKYELGVLRLRELRLNVIHAPNSMKGSEYLSQNPKARAEDIMWAFENKDIKAVIANVGGNDSINLIPYLDSNVIAANPKIFIGYSDVMYLHLYCYKCGLSTFYGDNLLTQIADQAGWHEYSKRWFVKTLFENDPIGIIEPAKEWTYEASNNFRSDIKRGYHPCLGYEFIQGQGIATGRLIGGHTGITELEGTAIELKDEDYNGAIMFIEDIPEFFDEEAIKGFFEYLGQREILSKLNGIILGKSNEERDFLERAKIIKKIVFDKYSCAIPIVYGLNFGHSSPMFILPYGAMAEINCENKTFSILESGVV
ncbi:LD-carboxypeptidase [Butyrivibrio sp. DSM 10294]|uniref:S66 peptidase family protein n=1 Tax=Butyrivibrio sp. DSM 10294 TaxID=2972457 RepID=UPI00234EDA27|nr:S66 peptidase family protein [Butyrivibrio sp. DSM 10294]MDC7294443.1 LD-carboxypeptidase [Butyrivibrio sp. DSM 10294]